MVESFTYDNHYGTITNHTKTVETNNPYAYTGRELDTPELYYYRARYYDPSLQRFLGEDPIGFEGWDYNFYRYVANNPIAYRDPTGEFWALVVRGAWVTGKWIVMKIKVWVKPKPRKGEYGGPGAGKPFKPKTKDKIRDRDNHRCVFCGKKTQKSGGISSSSEIDHAIPGR